MQHSMPQFKWELGIKTAGVARARELDQPRRTKIKMAEEAHSLEFSTFIIMYQHYQENRKNIH